MSQKNITLVMLVSIIAMFGALLIYDIKVNHRIDKILGKDTKENWKWQDNWTPDSKEKTKPPIIIEDDKEEGPVKPESQIVASDYNDAVAKSGKFGMPILIVFRAEWCHWCKKLEQEMEKESVKSMMMNYVFLSVDTDEDSSTGKKFNISGLPSYVITNAKGEKLKSGSGMKNADAFSKWLDESSMFKQPKQKQE